MLKKINPQHIIYISPDPILEGQTTATTHTVCTQQCVTIPMNTEYKRVFMSNDMVDKMQQSEGICCFKATVSSKGRRLCMNLQKNDSDNLMRGVGFYSSGEAEILRVCECMKSHGFNCIILSNAISFDCGVEIVLANNEFTIRGMICQEYYMIRKLLYEIIKKPNSL
jgi:hypothetical protein